MADDFKYHVTFTYTEPRGSTREGGLTSLHVVGTKEQIGKYVSENTIHLLERGGGPFTISPIHPANVMELKDR